MKLSKIQWCWHTFNGWIGCTKVSPGCVFCYAENETFPRVQRANGKELWGKGRPRHRTSEAYWKEPLRWNREATADRPRVFCASLSDWLDDEVPIEWLADLLKLIYDTPNLDWLLLTKRLQNWASRIHKARNHMMHVDAEVSVWLNDWLPKAEMPGMPARDGRAPANVWIGTSVEDQQRAAQRIPELLKIPAKIRFLSVEPMLGPIDLSKFLIHHGGDCAWQGEPVLPIHSCACAGRLFHWAIFGGESGPNARPCNIDWIRDGVEQCRAAGVAPFVKQLGANIHTDNANTLDWPDGAYMTGQGSLNNKKGGDMSEWPEGLRVREFPKK